MYPTADLEQVFLDDRPARKLTLSKLQESQLKTRFEDFYYNTFYMECYYFCEQCKNYFKIIKIEKVNCISFLALFLEREINLC